MTTRLRTAEIALHVGAAAFIVLAFVLLDMGAQALEAPEHHGDTMFVSFLTLALACLAIVAEVVALALRRHRL